MNKKLEEKRRKLAKEDMILLGLSDDPPKPKIKTIVHKFIHIPIDRRYIGMTQKERDAAKKVSNSK